MHCREILFTLRCIQGPASFRDWSTFLHYVRLRSYGASKLPNFRILAYFSHTKPLKRTFRWPAYSQGLHRRMITIFPSGSRTSKGVPSGSAVFLQLLVGELGTPNLPKRSPMANGYTSTEFYYTARRIWTTDVWKCAILRTDVLSHQISSTLPPKLPPKPHFGGPFSANPITERALRKSHVNGATKLKRYSYIGIGKYFRVCPNFSTRRRLGPQGPLM